MWIIKFYFLNREYFQGVKLLQFIKPLFVASIVSFFASNTVSANENAKLFGKMPDITDVALSPDGNKIAFIAPLKESGNALYVASTAGGVPTKLTAMDGKPNSLQWCEFVSDNRLICQLYSIIKYNNQEISRTQKIALNIDGTNAKMVERRDGMFANVIRFGSGGIVDWLPADKDEVLLTWYFAKEGVTGTRGGDKREGLAVLKFDTITGKSKLVEQPNREADTFLSDGQGNVRVMGAQTSRGATGYAGNKISWKYRKIDDDEWLDLGIYDGKTDTGFFRWKWMDPKILSSASKR